MKLADFNLLTDENIHPQVVKFLEKEGFVVIDVKASAWVGRSDRELLEEAEQRNAIILTHDSDFGKLIYTQQVEFTGVIYLRPGHFTPNFTISTLKALLTADLDLEKGLIVVAENTGKSVKIRHRQH